jgi:hypothetical protein
VGRGCGSQTEDLHELPGADVGLGVEAELLLAAEPGDVLVELEPASDDTSIRNSEPM